MPATTHLRSEARSYPCQLSRVSSMVFTCQWSNFRSLSATFWVLKIYLFLSSKPQRCFMNVPPIKQEGPGHTSKFSADCLLWSMFGQLNHQNHPFESIYLNFFPSPLNQVTAPKCPVTGVWGPSVHVILPLNPMFYKFMISSCLLWSPQLTKSRNAPSDTIQPVRPPGQTAAPWQVS